MGNFKGWEILVILALLLLLFGAKRLPDAARGLGRSLRIFKSEVKEMRNDDDDPAATQQTTQERREPPAGPPALESRPSATEHTPAPEPEVRER